jgi:UDP-N-acetylglucosamine/UDP-N-acetylgalactosamine diphosphorylase
MSYEQLKAQYEEAGQGHVFNFYDTLNEQEKSSLLAQLKDLEPERANTIFAKTVKEASGATTNIADIKPLPDTCLLSTFNTTEDKLQPIHQQGLEAIAHNKVAVILLAGGQGTRLGSSAPKGCYNIGLPSGKSLFQLQAERIRRLQEIATELRHKEGLSGDAIIPWYVMTSGPTRKDTVDFFEQHNYFGLPKQNVIFFEQGERDQSYYQGREYIVIRRRYSSSVYHGREVLHGFKVRGQVHNVCSAVTLILTLVTGICGS